MLRGGPWWAWQEYLAGEWALANEQASPLSWPCSQDKTHTLSLLKLDSKKTSTGKFQPCPKPSDRVLYEEWGADFPCPNVRLAVTFLSASGSGVCRHIIRPPSHAFFVCRDGQSVEVKVLSHSVVSDSLRPLDCSPPDSSVLGILQARILEWTAISFSGGSSQPRDRTQVSCTAGRFFTVWVTREAQRLSEPSLKSYASRQVAMFRLWPKSLAWRAFFQWTPVVRRGMLFCP